MPQLLLPSNASEAFNMFNDDAPEDCHNHCKHYDVDGECCECGDKKEPTVPIREFFEDPPGQKIKPREIEDISSEEEAIGLMGGYIMRGCGLRFDEDVT